MASGRGDFSKDEWRTLQFAYLWAFRTVMGDDAPLNLESDIGEAPIVRDRPLARRVIESLQTDMKKATKAFGKDRRSATHGLADVADLLDRKASPEEARGFKAAVVDLSSQTVTILEHVRDDPQIENATAGGQPLRDQWDAMVAEGEAAVAVIASALRS